MGYKRRQRAIFSSFLNRASHNMQEGLVFWIISSFFITTSLTQGNVLEFRSKRFFDNLDFASQNGWLDGRPHELPILHPRTNNLDLITTPLAEVTPEKTCLRYRHAEKKPI